MARGRRKGPKDPYEGLSNEWRSAVESGDDAELNKKLAETALEQQSILDDQVRDEDFQRAKSALKFAGESYRERKKIVKLKQKYLKRTLESRGKA